MTKTSETKLGGLVSFLLRVALAVPFLYAAIAAFITPTSWIGFLPPWISVIMPLQIALIIFSIYEILLSLWLLAGKWTRYAGLVAGATLLGITLFNVGALDIVFRDIGLMLAAVALAFMPHNK